MNTLYVHLIDPSGHERTLKIRDFPCILGTDLTDRFQLRDELIPRSAIQIDERADGRFTISTLAGAPSIRLGDFKFSSVEVPFHVPMRIGQTEFVLSTNQVKDSAIQFSSEQTPWYTESASGISLLNSIRKSSRTRLSIYLSGETGTGKEVLANLIHTWSDRARGAFVPINCGALAVSLAESELFGHVKGAFTGAMRDRPGALLQAHNGTLFLDEVGDLPLELQVKLLRFLECGEIRPVGSDRTLYADVRVICATHKPLLKLVQQGKFRQDLYFRLASIPIDIPTLRERPEDIRALAIEFSKPHSKALTEDAIRFLQSHAWPGNVRELRHSIERACGLAGEFEAVIHAQDFSFLKPQGEVDPENELPGITSLRDMEKILLLRALKLAHGNRADAAKILGVARSTLFEMLKRHQVVGPKTQELWASTL